MDHSENFAEENEKYISALRNLPKLNHSFGSESFSKEVASLLFGMGMEKYIDIFKTNNIHFDLFLSLTEEDLKILGIEDENDCSTIFRYISLGKNVKEGSSSTATAVSNDLTDDILIANNILNHSVILNSSLNFLLRKLSNFNLTDYYVCKEYNAKELLSIVGSKAIQQADINIKLIHSPSTGLIESIMKANNIELSPGLQDKLDGRRIVRKKRLALVLLISTGVCSLAVLANSYLRVS